MPCGTAFGADREQTTNAEDLMSELENGFQLGDAIAMVRRRLPIVAGAVVLGLIAGYLLFARAEATYSATARVKVNEIKLDQFAAENRAAKPDMPTERDLVKSDAVIETVRESLRLTGDNRSVRGRIFVVSDDTQVLRITFEGDTARQARDGANAAAEGYLAQRKASASSTATTTLARIDQELAALTDEQTSVQRALDVAPAGSTERAQLQVQQQRLRAEEGALTTQQAQLRGFDPETVGELTQRAGLPSASTSKMALGMAVGAFGLIVLSGLALAWLVDRRDSLGGGRRRIEQLVPGATIRVLPGAEGESASPAEIDTAIDRLAVELVAGGAPGKAASVLVVGAGREPPIALAEELASSLAFAGIPALFVLAGTAEREVRGAQVIASFADLVTSSSNVSGPAGLPERAGEAAGGAAGPLVTWLRPKGSAESAGLLRRAVVDSLITRAGRERFEAVIFVAPSPHPHRGGGRARQVGASLRAGGRTGGTGPG
jgi:capsular polysaccharide biosynthesis protein